LNLILPDVICRAMAQGAALVINISSGKDSQAMLMALVVAYHRNRWTGPIFALHMDLGRAEWPESIVHCQRIAAIAGVKLVVIKRPQGDLIQEIEERMLALAGTDKPYWPSSSNRYCTSDQKRDQANKILRQFPLVISAEGIRAEESTERGKKNPITLRDKVSSTKFEGMDVKSALSKWIELNELGAKKQPTLAITWFPIFDWTIDQVYTQCGHSIKERDHRRELYRDGRKAEALSDWWMHQAYIYGNDRVSCIFCILGNLNDLRTGAREHPKLLKQTYIPLEDGGGKTFKNKWSLKELLHE